MILLQLRYYRATFLRRYYVLSAPAPVILIMLIAGLVVAMERAGLTNAKAVEAVPSIFMRKIAESIPLGTAVLWMIFFSVCAFGYFLLQSAFQKIEAPFEKPKHFLGEY